MEKHLNMEIKPTNNTDTWIRISALPFSTFDKWAH